MVGTVNPCDTSIRQARRAFALLNSVREYKLSLSLLLSRQLSTRSLMHTGKEWMHCSAILIAPDRHQFFCGMPPWRQSVVRQSTACCHLQLIPVKITVCAQLRLSCSATLFQFNNFWDASSNLTDVSPFYSLTNLFLNFHSLNLSIRLGGFTLVCRFKRPGQQNYRHCVYSLISMSIE